MNTAPSQRRGGALAVICLSVFVISLDTTIVNVALPTLERSLHATNSQLQWIVDAFTLVFAALLLPCGSLGDRFGRRGTLALGLMAFAATSALAAFVSTSGQLIAARALMGVGAALIFPATLALISNIFPEPAGRARAIGIWAAMTGAGVATGPIAGGWLLEHYWWGSIFLVNVPISAAAVVAGHFLLPTSKDPGSPRIDAGGFVLSAAGLAMLTYTIIEAPGWGWVSARTGGGILVAAAVLGGFWAWERRRAHPMLDVGLFSSKRFSAASLSVTVAFFALFGFIFLITQYFQFVRAYTAFGTGLRVLPVAGSIAVSSAVAPRVVHWAGTKIVVAAGMVLFAAGVAWASTAGLGTPYLAIAAEMVLIGAGIGFTTSPATESVMGSVSRARAGVGSAVNDATRLVGGTLGVAVVGSVFASIYAHQLCTGVIARLPASARELASQSMASAYAVARHLPPPGQRAVITDANHAFLHGLQAGSLVAAATALAGAAAVLLLLPARASAVPVAEPSAEPAP